MIGDGKPAQPSVLLPVRVDKVQPRTLPKGVSFGVDNPGFFFSKPNYGMVFRSPEGRLIGGWFIDRTYTFGQGIESDLPEKETDEYPQGESRHTVPGWVPPGIQPSGVTMYVWPR
nr:hypothetical protein Ade03nite_23560 [Actinoplanes derwentensis]